MSIAMSTELRPYTVDDAFKPIHELVRTWVAQVADCDYGGVYGYQGKDAVENVENQRRSGFIPWTGGGAEAVLSADMGYCDGSGTTPGIIQPYLDSALNDADKNWDEENPEHPVEWLYAEPDTQLDLLQEQAAEREREHWKNKYWEFRDEWIRGTFFYKIRALYLRPHKDRDNESGEDEVLFCVGVNTDFEYGRDHISWLRCYGSDPNCTKWVWEATVKAKDVTKELIEQLVKDAENALWSA